MSDERQVAEATPWKKILPPGTQPASTPSADAPWTKVEQAPTPQAPAMLRRAPSSKPGEGLPTTGDDSYIDRSLTALGRAVPEIGKSALNFADNLWRSLLPTQEGARAGGEVIRKIGDVGTFASGGLMNPIGVGPEATATRPGWFGGRFEGRAIPGGAPGEAMRGFGRGPQPEPTPPPAPGPQLALPPPAIGPAGPTRALPPPTADIPGRPIPTPGTPGATGMIPRPGATMRTVPEPPPRAPATAAEAAGIAAGRDLPPRAPGTEGRAPSAARPEPLIPVGAERGHPSPLATALLENDVATVDRKLSNRFRQATGSPRAGSQGELDMQDRHMTTAVDSIIASKDNIQFRDPKDPTGNTLLKPGQLPRNLSEFTQAIAYLKKQIFQAYDQMATRVTGQGAQVSLAPTVAKLRQWAASPSAGISRTIREQALRMADEFEQTGAYSPSAAQDVVQTLNGKLSNFLNRVPGVEEIYSHPTLMNDVRDSLLTTLDQTMAQALGGPQYQVLRLRYGSLSAVEGNVANALSKQLGKAGGPFSRGLTTPEAMAALAGTLHFGPVGGMTTVAATESARGLSRFLYSPNYAIKTMFDRRAAGLTPPPAMTDYLSAQIASRLPNPPPPRPGPAYVGSSGM